MSLFLLFNHPTYQRCYQCPHSGEIICRCNTCERTWYISVCLSLLRTIAPVISHPALHRRALSWIAHRPTRTLRPFNGSCVITITTLHIRHFAVIMRIMQTLHSLPFTTTLHTPQHSTQPSCHQDTCATRVGELSRDETILSYT